MRTIIEKQKIAFQEGGINWRWYIRVMHENNWEWAFFRYDIKEDTLNARVKDMQQRVLKPTNNSKHIRRCPRFDSHYQFNL